MRRFSLCSSTCSVHPAGLRAGCKCSDHLSAGRSPACQGTVTITGTVNPPDLQNYFFEVADASADPNTATWTPVTLPSRNARHQRHAGAVEHDSIVADRQSIRCACASSITSGEITVVTVGAAAHHQ